MTQLLPYVIGGAVAVLALDLASSATRNLTSWPTVQQADIPASNLARKGDRLSAAGATIAKSEIATVEVVGLRDAAIVYRDRDGRELFRTDPLTNITIVTKGLVLPEVTVRQSNGSPVRSLPVELPREQARDRKSPAPREKIKVGCEPSFSPVASPAMAHHTGRCVAGLSAPQQFAELAR